MRGIYFLLQQEKYVMATSGWRKISSAPKDGTEIITCIVGYKPMLAAFQTHEGISRWGLDPETFMAHDHFVEYWTGSQYDPTHWRPIPAGPTA